MNESDDPKISKLLKASPNLVPPESFYRGVMDKIAQKQSARSWFFSVPAKVMVSACALLIIVFVTHETRRTKPALFDQVQTQPMESESRPALKSPLFKQVAPKPIASMFNPIEKTKKVSRLSNESPNYYWQGTQLYNLGRLGEAHESFEKAVQNKQNSKESEAYLLQIRQQIVNSARKRTESPAALEPLAQKDDLASIPAVQNRINRNIGAFVDHPSPFEELDKAKPQSEAVKKTRAAYVEQARDTETGAATQQSFSVPAKMDAKAFGGIRAKDALGYGNGGSVAAEISDGPIAAAPVQRELALSTNGAPDNLKKQQGFEIAGPVSARKVLEKTLPIYPAWAQEQGLEAIVRLYARILPAGNVDSNVRVTRTTGYPALDQLAIDAVKKWKFAPAAEDSWGIITFQFKPSN